MNDTDKKVCKWYESQINQAKADDLPKIQDSFLAEMSAKNAHFCAILAAAKKFCPKGTPISSTTCYFDYF